MDDYVTGTGLPFQDLKALNSTIINYTGALGFKLTVKHSLTLKDQGETETLFSLPFLSITRDIGFFKENVIIHCTESNSALEEKKSTRNLFGLKSNEILMLLPLTQARRDFIKELDDNFWRYFLSTEKEITSKNSILEESDVEISLDAQSSFPPISDRNILAMESSQSPIFLLYAQRKHRYRSLVKVIDLQGRNKDFQDLKSLKIKEFSICFQNLNSLLTLSSVKLFFLLFLLINFNRLFTHSDFLTRSLMFYFLINLMRTTRPATAKKISIILLNPTQV